MPRIKGVTAGLQIIDPTSLFTEMATEYARRKAMQIKAHNQTMGFDNGAIGVCFVADAHLGDFGVNVGRLFSEAQTIVATPNLYIVTCGDMVANKIVGKLTNERFNTETTAEREWELLRSYLELIAPKLVGSVAGNHDEWVTQLTGVSLFKEIVKQVAPESLYASNDVRVNIKVRGASFPTRIRHRWRYRTKFNSSHGIEDMCRFDADFICGIGAHVHQGALCREFVSRGGTGLACLAGTYQDLDDYPVRMGFPKNANSTAVTVIYRDDGKMLGVSDLGLAVELMQRY